MTINLKTLAKTKDGRRRLVAPIETMRGARNNHRVSLYYGDAPYSSGRIRILEGDPNVKPPVSCGLQLWLWHRRDLAIAKVMPQVRDVELLLYLRHGLGASQADRAEAVAHFLGEAESKWVLGSLAYMAEFPDWRSRKAPQPALGDR